MFVSLLLLLLWLLLGLQQTHQTSNQTRPKKTTEKEKTHVFQGFRARVDNNKAKKQPPAKKKSENLLSLSSCQYFCRLFLLLLFSYLFSFSFPIYCPFLCHFSSSWLPSLNAKASFA